jgi:predicted ATPase/DNA-binding SARP family transcriptional activator
VNTCRLRLFGNVRLEADDQSLEAFGTVRAAKLLVLLSLSRSGKMPREHLAEQLWPDDYYDATRLRLRQEIHRLKRALGNQADLIGSSPTEVWIDRSRLVTDLDDVEHASARALDPSLILDPFLPGWEDPWVIAQRRHAEHLQVQAGVAAITRAVQAGEADRVQGLLQQMIARHPLNEDLRKLAVEVHAHLGSLAAAVAEFQDYRRKVKEQLGVETPDVSDRLARDLAARTPDATTDADWSTTLPVSAEPIYGREELAVRVIDQLRASPTRVVSLVGPGGIGKTRLAVEVAQRLAADGGRVAFASMVEVAEPLLWAREVLAQLGSDPPGEADPVKFLAVLVAQENTVLVLDNLESVLPDAAEGISQLRSLAPTLRILITSVIPSRVQGEQLIPVGPLDPRVAGAEFLRNAYHQHRPDVVISDEVAGVLMQIADRLDGYPLALRLASARLRLLSPQHLLQQLEHALARSSAHDLPERHRSLESALASSFDSLSEAQLRAVDHISAYPGGMGMDLCALALADEPYLDLIESLLDLALLAMEDHSGLVRVRMLVPVRNYVQRRQGEDARVALERSAVHTVLELLAQHDIAPWKPLPRWVIDLVESEADNILFAWRWAIDHEPERAWPIAAKVARLEMSRGRSLALLDSLEAHRVRWQDTSADQAIELELTLAHLCFACHQEERAREPLQRARELKGSATWEAFLTFSVAQLAFRREFESSEDLARRTLELAKDAGDTYLTGRALRLLGVIVNYKRRPEEALECLSAAFEKLQASGAETELPSLGTYLGATLWFTDRKREAVEVIERSKASLRGLRDPVAAAFMYETEGRIATADGRPAEAEAFLRESLRIWEAIGSPYQEADQLHCLSRALILQGKWDEARWSVREAGRRWVLDDNYGGLCCTLTLLAEVLFHDGDAERARQVIGFSRDLERELSLIVVESEIDHRDAAAAQFGGECTHELPVTKEQAHALFAWIR